MNKNILLFGILLAISLLVVGSLMFYSRNHYEDEYVYNPPETATTTEATQPTIPTDDSKGTVESKQLQYLIEEEKLAFDAYTAFYEKYESQIFGNILQSESTHQDRVLELLNEKNVADPRTGKSGVFTDTALQSLYDQLIVQGMESRNEAIKAGIAIEERDITDLSQLISESEDNAVIQVLEDLKKGSENHLRAFTRQL